MESTGARLLGWWTRDAWLDSHSGFAVTWFQVLACDYDGTLATAGKVAHATARAIERVRASGRRVVLVTGRRFDDLLEVCPEIDLFDLVVAENGGVLFAPGTGEIENLAGPPSPLLLARLEARGVPFSVGRVIIATVEPHGQEVSDAIRELGLELDVVMNREAAMVLPRGVSKESGLERALGRLGISAHNTIAVGDAENDAELLRRAGLAVAVANAVPALASQADIVTSAADGAGVRELIEDTILGDFEPLRRRLLRRTILLGQRSDGLPFDYPVLGPPLLVTGTGPETTVVLVERLLEQLLGGGYVVWLLGARVDDQPGIAERLGIRTLRDAAPRRLAELAIGRPSSLALDVAGLARRERLRVCRRFLRVVARQRADSGAPHWVVIDAAEQLFSSRPEWSDLIRDFDWTGVCLVSSRPALLAPELRRAARHVLSTSLESIVEETGLVAREEVPDPGLESGEALSVALDLAPGRRVVRFRIAPAATRPRL